MVSNFIGLFLFIYSALCFGQTSSPLMINSAKIKGFTITAESLERDLEKDMIYLKGNVHIIYQNQYFEADNGEINFTKKQATFVGNVKVQTPNYQIGGKKIVLDYESSQGIIYIGYVQSNNVRFQGDVIEKMSDKEFFVTNADYTTCSNCPATWSFEGSQIRAELGGYAYIKSSFLKVGDVPVFWLPYLVVPLKSDRQTGLLPPEIGHISNRNLVISEELFWAISRSQDATFTFKNYELGGLKPMIEYRYVLSNESFGQFNASFIRDPVFAGEERYQSYAKVHEDRPEILNRWAFKTVNQYSLENSNKLQMKVNLVSDLQYPKDFYDEYKNYADPSLENRLTLTHFFDQSTISLDTSYYRNLLQADPLADNTASVHRLPDIRFESTYKQFFETPFYYKISTNWVNFYREKYYDDISVYLKDGQQQNYVSNNNKDPACEHNGDASCKPQEDNIYNENNDVLRAGQRALFKSALTTEAYNVADLMSVTPTLSYNEAQYLFRTPQNSTSYRRFVQFDLSTRTKFYKIYDEDTAITGEKFKNIIIPELKYSNIPWIDQDKNPFFGVTDGPEITFSPPISDKDLNYPGGILFDYEDRINQYNLISFTLIDALVRKKTKDNSYKTLLTLVLTQSYDLYQAQYGKNKDQPLSNMHADLILDFDHVHSTTSVDYAPYKSATDTITSLSYLNDKQQYFKVGWSSKRTTEPNQDDALFAIGFVSSYVNLLTGFIFDASENRDSSSSRLKKFSLITQLKPPGECWAVNFYRDQNFGGSIEWKIKFDFSFDGKPTKVIPPAELNIN